MNFLTLSFIALLISLGFYGTLGSVNGNNYSKILWEIVMFAFVIGTLVLTISGKVLRKNQKEYFSRIGSSIIISAMITLMGTGFESLLKIINITKIAIFGHLVVWSGLIFLSFMLASLFIEFLKTIYSENKKKIIK